VRRTLGYFRDALVEGGFVLLEEQITDACLFLWGLDSFIWETATDERSFGLWMSWQEWLAVVEDVEGLEMLCWHRSEYHVTMLLRKTTPDKAAQKADSVVVEDWAQLLATSRPPLLPPPSGAAGSAVAPLRQVFKSAGADGLVKTLRLEEGRDSWALAALVDVDGSCPPLVGKPEAQGGTRLPLTFTHCLGGQLGSLVPVPLTALPAEPGQARGAASAASGGPGHPEAEEAAEGEAWTGRNVALHILRPGDLGTLAWIEAPTTCDYAVRVAFSALNFKDVMYALGKLRLEEPSFGLEFSGTDARSGARVMGIGTSSCIALRTKPTLCWPVPPAMTLKEAATIPVVYATALFALFEKANLKRGQTCLVHAGSGGVGHAAIWLCQARGVEVFATCSDAKRAYVKATFGLDDAHLGNSRNTSFRETVLEATRGQGVHCVLNSLSGPLLDASLQCVKSYGHFCEIGKYDLQSNTPVGLKAFEANVSYHAIDLAAMFTDPDMSQVLQQLLADALAQGQVKPLPAAVFPAEEVEQALRHMSNGKHKGKVLVKMAGFRGDDQAGGQEGGQPEASTPEAETGSLAPPAAPSAARAAPSAALPRFTTGGTHVVTGGLGGFGLELAGWLLRCGARKVVCTSRAGVTTGWQRYRFDALAAEFGAGAVEVSSLDVVDAAQCAELLAAADQAGAINGNGGGGGGGGGELKGVWHVAMVLQDVLFRNMTAKKWETCNAVKAAGVHHLDAWTRKHLPAAQLDAFVAFSSVSSLFGNVGQANYAHANAACETAVLARQAAGHKASAVQWGMIDNVGFFSSNDAKVLETFLAFQNIDASLESLHHLVARGGVTTSYRLVADEKSGGGAEGLAALELSVGAVQVKVAEILGGAGADYDPGTPLNDYGLDSLSSIEVVNWMNRHTTAAVTPAFMTLDMTIAKMHEYMAENLKE